MVDEEKNNLCPFGCQTESLKEHGYCRHLAGFTNDGKEMERVEEIRDKKGAFVRYRVNGEKTEKIIKGDVMVPMGVSSRVYRAEQSKAS